MSIFQRLFGGRQHDSQESPDIPEVLSAPVVSETSMVAGTGGETRPLPPLEEVRSPSSHLKIGQATDGGMVRANNQDALLTVTGVIEGAQNLPVFGVFIVADGMGGHTDGERASQVAAKTLVAHLLTEVYLKMILVSQEPSSSQPIISDVLEEGIIQADRAVKDLVPEGGTTLTATIIHGNLLYVGHVGDSRAYLINGDNMELITRDHSLARRLQEIGHLTPEEAEAYPQKNVLYKALGQGEALEDVDRATRRLLPGVRLLLCSDGLWGEVDEDAILKIILETPDNQEACDRLVAAANQAGGRDNITAVLVETPS